jgi:hypothetical protein
MWNQSSRNAHFTFDLLKDNDTDPKINLDINLDR